MEPELEKNHNFVVIISIIIIIIIVVVIIVTIIIKRKNVTCYNYSVPLQHLPHHHKGEPAPLLGCACHQIINVMVRQIMKTSVQMMMIAGIFMISPAINIMITMIALMMMMTKIIISQGVVYVRLLIIGTGQPQA